MCRWFAYISAQEKILLYDVLVAPDNAIIYQVKSDYMEGLFPHRRDTGALIGDPNEVSNALSGQNKLYNLNLDGFGVSWYTPTQGEFNPKISGTRPQRYKTIQPPLNDSNFSSIAENSSSHCVLAHVRQASPPGVVHLYNNHPYAFDRHILQHNGAISNFSAIRYQMCAEMLPNALANIRGTTDSEHFAGLYMTYLTGSEEDWTRQYTLDEMKAALLKTIQRVIELQVKTLPPQSLSPSSLNICVTDGEQLIAIRFRNSLGDYNMPPTLFYSTTAGATLDRSYKAAPNAPDSPDSRISVGHKDPRTHKRHVIVASEPTTHDETEWTPLEKNQLIIVDKESHFRLEPAPKVQELEEIPVVIVRVKP